MKIINPLYDKAFKYLMENEKFARRVLSVILDEEVMSVTLRQQETMHPDERRGLTLFRLDFRADIRQPDGTVKTVLIELQKSKFATDIQRFRAYLGSQYMDGKQKGQKVQEPEPAYQAPYPIITIYILGYNLDDLPYMAVTVNRDVIDSVSKERLDVKSTFIELLTHTSHIIQVLRLPAERRTRLEQFFTLFDQGMISDEDYILDLIEVPEEFGDMARYLQGPLTDDMFRRNLAAEEEIDAIFDAQDAKYLRQIVALQDEIEQAVQETMKAKQEKKKEKQDKQRALYEKKQLEQRMKQTEQEKKQAEEHTKAALVKLARLMKASGATSEEIKQETGLWPEGYK